MRVLIVEDERKIATYVKRGLEEQGYAVDLAYTGQEALDWADVVEFDLIILDILLPEQNGIEVCNELRGRGVQTPVLMLTARDTIQDRVVGLDAGADDYLVKPFAMRELLARLRALSRRAPDVPRAAVLRIADLELDTRTHKARRGGQSIELTAKEYALLECLMRHPEQVLTREAIADHVWSYDSTHESNIVDVYIRNLRRKLDDPFETRLIHTIRGSGYRISAEGAA
jgi:DNA-binding response OmpR family regulator